MHYTFVQLAVCLSLVSNATGALAKQDVANPERITNDPDTGTIELRLAIPGATFFSSQSNPALGIVVGDPATTFVTGLGGGVGYFLSRHFELGGEASLAVVADSGRSVFELYAGPFGRYVRPIATSFSVWGEGKVGILYNHSAVTVRGGSATNNLSEFRLGASGGVDFNVHKNLALYAGVGLDMYMGSSLIVPIGVTYGIRGYL